MNIEYKPDIRYEQIHINGLDTLTHNQAIIYKNRVNNSIIEKFGYNHKDMFNYKFDPVKSLHLLPDIELCGVELANAINNNKNIALVSDFDADGVNSAAVAHVAFRDIFKVNKNNFVSIVNRRRTGTGFSVSLVERILELHKEWPVDVVVTFDHGSSCNKAYGVLKDAGIETIILTDHHIIPEDEYPTNANIVINPHREDSEYYKDVSGCYVAYMTMLSTYFNLTKTTNVKALDILLPYVAFSTISDVMSLQLPINRQVVKLGLRIMNTFKSPVWIALKRLLQIHNTINANDIGFKLAPLINTANRVDEEGLAFSLLVGESVEECMLYGKTLLEFSINRKIVQKEVIKQVIPTIDLNKFPNSIVIEIDSKYAINGIIAGNIGERYYKPTVCFLGNENSDVITGSGRGITQGIDLASVYKKIQENSDIVIKYGGHELAAGISIKKTGIEEFKILFDKYILEQSISKSIDTVREFKYDIRLSHKDINPFIVHELERIAPYGKDWKKPVYYSRLKVYSIMTFGTIAKIKFVSDNKIIEAMHYFNTKNGVIDVNNIKEILYTGSMVDVLFNLDISTFNDVVNLDLTIIDIKRST